MRILFLSRPLPNSSGTPLEKRLAGRLAELVDLGHDVLILSRWQEDLPELSLPKRVEIRFPFRRFAAWEWPQAIPLVLQWRPDVIHVIDPGLGAHDKLLGAEASLFPVIEGIRRGFRRLSVPQILVSTHLEEVESWTAIGARHIESQWLSPRSTTFLSQNSFVNRDDRNRVRAFLAGNETERPNFSSTVPRLLEAMCHWPHLEVGCIYDRARQSRSEKAQLLKWERFFSDSASRLHFIPQNFQEEVLETQVWDVGIVAGLKPEAKYRWQELLPMPLIISEALGNLGDDPRTMAQVSELAWIEQSLAISQNTELRSAAWNRIQEGAHLFLRDDATNRISRLYATALAECASPS